MHARIGLALLVVMAAGSAQPMAGTYTIDNSGGGDFGSFSHALAVLLARGMNGAVVFEALQGIYNDGLLDLRGLSTNGKTLTFRSRPGHSVIIDGSGSAAIFLADGNEGATHNVKIEGLTLTNSSPGGWPVYAVNRLNGWRVSNCTFLTSTGPWFNGSYDSVVDCHIRLSGNTGIYLYSSSNCWIVNNFVSGARMMCVYFNTASGNTIANNTFITDSTAAGAVGMYQNQSSNTFYNNIVVSSSYCLYTSSQPVNSDYNCWYRHSGDSRLFYLSNVGAMGLLSWRSRSGNRIDMNSMEADPLVVDRISDLHLQAESPCIDAGSAISGIARDIDGQMRPHGAACDIGADEYYPVGLAGEAGCRLSDSRLRIAPNPARYRATVWFSSDFSAGGFAPAAVGLYDACGRCVRVFSACLADEAGYKVDLDLRGLAAGTYFVQATVGRCRIGDKLLVR